jgi:predicted GNAT family N-acyltransferase
LQITLARYDADYAAIRGVRFAVFVHEQSVPAEIELDERDPHCVHVLAHDAESRAVGTGRIDLDAGGKIGRVAVLAQTRGMGVGTALMQRMHDIARDAALPSVWCNAQLSAAPFYSKLGYEVTSEPFLEAGISHVRMHREL